MKNKEIVLEVKNLKKVFNVANGKILKAVDDVSLNIYEGETLGIVGESGSGKTTLGRTIIGVYKPFAGDIRLFNYDINNLSSKDKKNITKDVQMIFQDPYSSLDPQLTVYGIIAEGIDIHKLAKDKSEKSKMISTLLEQVGLNQSHKNRYIHEFSGGQRQRVGIARALAVNPKFLMCDEPISALDVSMRAQIINLLIDLKNERNLTMLFIAHDLSIVKHISDRIAVMYLGRIVELADSNELYRSPKHPYTEALLSAIPSVNPLKNNKKNRIQLEGEIPSPINTPKGCSFYNRCKYATENCNLNRPELIEVEDNHFVACHLYDKQI